MGILPEKTRRRQEDNLWIGLHLRQSQVVQCGWAEAVRTRQVTVASYRLTADGELHVGGTPGDDTFQVTPGTAAGSVLVRRNGTLLGTFTPTGAIRLFGGDGSNSAVVDGTNVVD